MRERESERENRKKESNWRSPESWRNKSFSSSASNLKLQPRVKLNQIKGQTLCAKNLSHMSEFFFCDPLFKNRFELQSWKANTKKPTDLSIVTVVAMTSKKPTTTTTTAATTLPAFESFWEPPTKLERDLRWAELFYFSSIFILSQTKRPGPV